MENLRQTFLDTIAPARALLASPEVAQGWDRPSALAMWNVSGLAGHLVRATTSVSAYLDRGEPEGPPMSPAEYFAAAVDTPDLSSPLHSAIREKGNAQAAKGHSALVDEIDAAAADLRARLQEEPSGRLIRVFKDLVLTLDDYLATRVLELVVHIDDLAVSVNLPTPDLPGSALDVTIEILIGVARHRHGDVAVLRALTRRERAQAETLHVL